MELASFVGACSRTDAGGKDLSNVHAVTPAVQCPYTGRSKWPGHARCLLAKPLPLPVHMLSSLTFEARASASDSSDTVTALRLTPPSCARPTSSRPRRSSALVSAAYRSAASASGRKYTGPNQRTCRSGPLPFAVLSLVRKRITGKRIFFHQLTIIVSIIHSTTTRCNSLARTVLDLWLL